MAEPNWVNGDPYARGEYDCPVCGEPEMADCECGSCGYTVEEIPDEPYDRWKES